MLIRLARLVFIPRILSLPQSQDLLVQANAPLLLVIAAIEVLSFNRVFIIESLIICCILGCQRSYASSGFQRSSDWFLAEATGTLLWIQVCVVLTLRLTLVPHYLVQGCLCVCFNRVFRVLTAAAYSVFCPLCCLEIWIVCCIAYLRSSSYLNRTLDILVLFDHRSLLMQIHCCFLRFQQLILRNFPINLRKWLVNRYAISVLLPQSRIV